MALDSNSIKKICLLNWGLIGDVLIRSPIIEALHQHFPHSEIDVVVDPSSKDVFKNHPDVHRIIPFSRKKEPLTQYLRHTIKKLIFIRKQRYDICINFYSGGSSPLVSLVSGAHYRVGYNHSRALRLSNNVLVNKPSFCGNWNRAYAELLVPLGIPLDKVKQCPSFYCSDTARAKIRKILTKLDKPLVGVNLGAGTDVKRWPVDNFLQLTRWINSKYDINFVLFTNPGMEHLSEEFTNVFEPTDHLTKLPLLSLDEVGAVMEQCSIIITSDTSLMHMSFGLRKPTLVLFTSTRPEVVEPEDCLHADCFIEDSRQTDPCGNPLGTKNIPVEYVQEKFNTLFKETGLST